MGPLEPQLLCFGDLGYGGHSPMATMLHVGLGEVSPLKQPCVVPLGIPHLLSFNGGSCEALGTLRETRACFGVTGHDKDLGLRGEAAVRRTLPRAAVVLASRSLRAHLPDCAIVAVTLSCHPASPALTGDTPRFHQPWRVALKSALLFVNIFLHA